MGEPREAWVHKVMESVFHLLQERLHDVKSKLAGLKLDSLENQSLEGKERVLSLREKQRGEERLRRVIRRCELYVQRHQMLKEMNARGRKTK